MAHASITVRLDDDVRDRIDEVRAELVPALQAAADLATAARELIDFVPGSASPIVLPRQRLAALQAAVDNFTDVGAALLAGEVQA
jgi:hypothetical protein